jgi:hypothetical protein
MTSPSGAYTLELAPEREERDGRTWDYRRLRIQDAQGELVYESPERFAAWFPLEAAWDAHDRAWVASADTGTVVFEPAPGGWQRAVWDPDAPAPTMWDAGTGAEVPVITDAPPEALR